MNHFSITTNRIPTRTTVEIAVLFSIPVLLAGIHAATTETTRAQFYFYLSEPSLYSAWTAAFIHSSWEHLEANSVAYLLATLTTYTIYAKWGQKRLMLGIFGIILITTPPVQSLIDYTVLTVHLNATGSEAHTKGFSGVVGAFTGMLMASIGGYVTHRTNEVVGNNALLTVFFLSAIVIFSVYTPSGHILVSSAGLLLVGFVIITYGIVTELNVHDLSDVRNRIDAAFWDVMLVYTSTVVALVLVYLSFPANPGGGETTANILAHLTGILYGFLVTIVLIRSV